MKSKILGLVAVGLLAGPMAAQAATITVTEAFRFIRTDTYAQSGATIDSGTVSVNGPSTPIGGTAAQGSFVSTREDTASVSTLSGTASATARVQIDSDYSATPSALIFDVAAILGLSTATTGDGQIYNPLPDGNCCRSFSFYNSFTKFDVVGGNVLWSIAGSGTGFSLYDLTNLTYVTINSFGNGTLAPGTYRYQLSSSMERRTAGSSSDQSVADVEFRVTAAQVPEPSALALLGLGLLGLGVTRRKAA